MDMISRLKEWGYIEWTTLYWPHYENATYIWANSTCANGAGRTHCIGSDGKLNDRINPKKDLQALKASKDSGKTVIAGFIARQTGEEMKLYCREDFSKRTGNSSDDEKWLKKVAIGEGNYHVSYLGKPYAKVNFMRGIFVPKVEEIFGRNSVEFMLAELAAGDGDLWGRYSGNPVAWQAYQNIIDKLLWKEV